MNYLIFKKLFIFNFKYIFVFVFCSTISHVTYGSKHVIDLSGIWNFRIDSTDAGVREKWFNKTFVDQIKLPGTTDDSNFGVPNVLLPELKKPQLLRLTRKNSYIGVAWYSKNIEIPKGWNNKSVFLKLERVIWESSVWIDGSEITEKQESLTSPHYYNLSSYLTPGKHLISIRIDNRKKHDISINEMAHAYTNETQIKWNGIIGEISCKAEDKIHISGLQLFPDIDKKNVRVKMLINNGTLKQSKGIAQIYAVSEQTKSKLETVSLPIKITGTGSTVEFEYPMGKNPLLWDEFNPNLYKLTVRIKGPGFESIESETFGMRSLTNSNSQFQLNGNQIFLRGTLECCIFPLKGYPPMEKEGWYKVFRTASEWGLNHLRFHSWCPPEAAFEVADEMGFYLQVELPYWALTVGKDSLTNRFLLNESQRIISEYGNHPSFCFWSMGNELEGDFSMLRNLVDGLKKADPRHLYATTSFTFQKGFGTSPLIQDDFFVTQWTNNGWVRGQGVFNTNIPNFDLDYQKSIEGIKVPVVTHEIGQYSVYPNLNEIEKYTGLLDPLNFKAIKADLIKKGLLHKANDFLMSSGKLAALLYKEEIERAIKTPGISGFQLLDLHDFPGQGTALVGLLDAFWDNKGFTNAKEFTQACSSVVPLVKFPKAVYLNTEVFKADVELANYSSNEIKGKQIKWTLCNSMKQILSQGQTSDVKLSKGYNSKLTTIEVSLNTVTAASQLTLTVWVDGTEFSNSWKIWVYPVNLPFIESKTIYTRDYDEAINALEGGRNVLFNPVWEKVKGIEGKFVPVFWSPVHFPKQAGTMGLLCNPTHPALKNFPTDIHTDWQWWDLLKNSKTLILDTISTVTPIIEMIDNFTANRRLCNTFEAKYGKAKLVFTSIDLERNLETRPVARQLRYSILSYMNSNQFNPDNNIKKEDFKQLLDSQIQTTNDKPESIY